jgi:nitrogenase subunit NifH
MKLSSNLTKTFLGGIINSTKSIVRKLNSIQEKITVLEVEKEQLMKEIERAEETGKHFLNGRNLLSVIKEIESGKALKDLVEEINNSQIEKVPQNDMIEENHKIPEESIDTTKVPVDNYLNVQERML